MAVAVDGPKAVVLKSDDNVAVAARPIPRGFVLASGRADDRGPRADRFGAQGRPGRHRGGRAGAASTGRSSASHRRRSPPARTSTSIISKPTCSSATMPLPRSGRRRRSRTSSRTFRGYPRPDGRVGTRNYIAVISTVNCSASTSRYVADRFRDGAWRSRFPNVDGVFAITHKGGCGLPFEGPDHQILERVLAGFAHHPNVAAYVIVGLGCEVSFASAPGRAARPGHAGDGERQRPPKGRPTGPGRSISRRRGGSPARSRRRRGPSTS